MPDRNENPKAEPAKKETKETLQDSGKNSVTPKPEVPVVLEQHHDIQVRVSATAALAPDYFPDGAATAKSESSAMA